MKVDHVRRCLAALYTDHYDVIKCNYKVFILALPRWDTDVSIDRLKPVHVIRDIPANPPTQPVGTTCSQLSG